MSGSLVSLTLDKAMWFLSELFEIVKGDAFIAIIISAPDLDKLSKRADCVVALEKISKPGAYGVVVGKRTSKYSLPSNDKVYKITQAVEKPSKKISNLAIMALNKFTPDVMKILKKIPAGYGGEIQITDAIQHMIDSQMNVLGYEYHHSCTRLDIGTPDTYWHAQQHSKKLASKGWM